MEFVRKRWPANVSADAEAKASNLSNLKFNLFSAEFFI